MKNQDNVHFHLQLLQNVIGRMATNSASAKTWCITLVSALVVLLVERKSNHLNLIVLIPIVLFYSVDVYYLALEKGFRQSYEGFVNKIHTNNIEESDFYLIKPIGESNTLRKAAIKSLSTTGFYLGMFIVVMVLGCFL